MIRCAKENLIFKKLFAIEMAVLSVFWHKNAMVL